MSNVLKFYADSGELKRFKISMKSKGHKLLTCFDMIPVISPDNQYLILWKLIVMFIEVFYFLELPAYIFFGPGLIVTIDLNSKAFLSET